MFIYVQAEKMKLYAQIARVQQLKQLKIVKRN